jgi:hypothetical protein
MKAQPTEGKWMATEDGRIVSEKLRRKGYSDWICQMPYGSASEAKQMPEAAANAKIIAAAPELLEALECMIIAMTDGTVTGNTKQEILNDAMEAVNKARC